MNQRKKNTPLLGYSKLRLLSGFNLRELAAAQTALDYYSRWSYMFVGQAMPDNVWLGFPAQQKCRSQSLLRHNNLPLVNVTQYTLCYIHKNTIIQDEFPVRNSSLFFYAVF